MQRVLVLLGHPHSSSFCGALAGAYAEGARKAGSEVDYIELGELSFDPILHKGYAEIQELEPDLVKLQESIRRADLLVIVYPTWWGSVPALLKGALDRTILPGFGFKYHKNSPLWDKLLTGKRARIITTMDAPRWYYRFVYHSPGTNMLKRALLHFCGVRPVRTTYLDRVRSKDAAWRTNTLERITHLATRDVRA